MEKLILALLLCEVFMFMNCRADVVQCVLKSPCICSFPSGEEIDLSSFNSVIENPSGINVTQYFYYPCPTAQSTCGDNNAAFCSKTGEHIEVLGTFSNVTFGRNIENASYVQYMVAVGSNVTQTSVLMLNCTMSTKNTIKEDPMFHNTDKRRFILSSKSACLTKSGSGTNDDDDEISSGGVLVILVLVFGALYLFGGMAVLKYIRGASGVEIIPHYEFWSDLPFLVKDGIMFTLSGCQGSASYDRI